MSFFSKPLTVPPLDRAQLRKLVRILFIDDQGSGRATALRQRGYNTFEKSDLADLAELERNEFHIIFCDIQGVGKELTPEKEGAGLIKLIKEKIRYPAVIAFSGFSFIPGEEKFRLMREWADDVIEKNAPLEEYITLVEEWGTKVFSYDRCIELLTTMTGQPKEAIQKIATRLARKPPSSWKDVLEPLGVAATTTATVIEILKLVLAFSGAA